MKVICPKCQFENQGDATRVVCARCATIIDVRPDTGGGFDPRRQPQRMNYPTAPVVPPPAMHDGDVYATSINDDFDDVLDIPRPTQSSYQATDAAPVYEDVFATPNYEVNYDTGYDAQPNYGMPQPERRSTADDHYRTALPEPHDTPSYGVPPETEFMGWPVLPEDTTDPGMAPTSAFGRSNWVMRVLALAAVVVVLTGIAYFLLKGPLGSRGKSDNVAVSSEPADGGGATVPGGNGTAAPTGKTGGTAAANPPPAAVSQAPVPPTTKTGDTPTMVPITPLSGTGAQDKPVGPSGPDKTVKAPVSVPPPSTQTQTASGVPPTPNSGSFTLQIGSFDDAGKANERIGSLKSAGVLVRVVPKDIPGRGTWHRVQIGRFPSRERALSYGNQLRSRGLVQDFIAIPVGQ